MIDDTPKKLVGNDKVAGWATEGGTPIHHKNAKSTIDSLNSILKMDESQLTMRSQKVVGKLRGLSDIYVILDDSSSSLLAMQPATFEKSYVNDKKTFDHHITIYYKPTLKQWNRFLEYGLSDNDEIDITVRGLYYSDDIGAEAFTVDIFQNGTKIDVSDRILHITHSLREGVDAKDSNVMLRSSDKIEKGIPQLKIKGKVSFVTIK